MSCTYIFYGLTLAAEDADVVKDIVRKHPQYRKMHTEEGYQHVNDEDVTRPSFTAVSSYNRDEKPTKFYYYIDEFESGYVDDDESVADIDPRKMIAFENLSTDAVQFMEELDEYIHKHVNIKTSVGWFMVACDFTDDTSSEVSINSTDSTDSTIVGNSDDKTIAPVTKPTFSDIVTTSMSTVIDMVSKFVNSSVHGADTPIIDDNDTSGDSTVGDEDVNNDVVNDDDVNNDVNNIKLLTPVDLTN